MAGKNTDVWYARCRHFIVCSENEDPVPPKTKNKAPLHVSVTLYVFTDEKQLKAWQLLCSQRDHSSVKKEQNRYELGHFGLFLNHFVFTIYY